MSTEPLKVLESRRREKRNGPRARMLRLVGPRSRRTMLLLGFLLFTCLLIPREPDFEVITLREGFPAKRDVIAPFQFYLLKDRALYHAEQATAARKVPPIYSVDPSVAPQVHAALDSLLGEDPKRAPSVGSRLQGLGLSPSTLRVLTGPDGQRVVVLAQRIAEEAYAAGLMAEIESGRLETDASAASVQRDGMRVPVTWASLYDLDSVREMAWDQGARAFPNRPEAARALQELIAAVLVPNLRYEASTTERIRTESRNAVEPYDGLVRKDEKIIGSHEIATALQRPFC